MGRVVIAVIAAVVGCGSSNSVEPRRAAPSRAELGRHALDEASGCIDRADWACARSALDTAERYDVSTAALRTRAATAALKIARDQYDAATKVVASSRRDHLAHAAATAAMVHVFTPRGDNVAAAEELAVRIAARER